MSKLVEPHFGKRGQGPVTDIPAASRMLTLLEDTEARRKGFRVDQIRRRIAGRLSVPEKTLLHIRNQRRKSVPSFLLLGIRNLLIEVLQAEIAKLEHEISVAKQIGMDCREDAFEQAAASIAHARQILEGANQRS
jgi:hypothetical protein